VPSRLVRQAARQLTAKPCSYLTKLCLAPSSHSCHASCSSQGLASLQPRCIPYKACLLTEAKTHKHYKVCGASTSVGRRPYQSQSDRSCWGGYAAPALLVSALAQRLYIFLLAQDQRLLTCHAKKPRCGRAFVFVPHTSGTPPATSVPQEVPLEVSYSR
jgi:hypothetical protein